ncbi:hypothetical protein [Thermococcus sp.]|uniref:hypothetical protein n=1 Tax=Thermococcus sp. TaxID=35749 RepID=UPI0025D14EE2|nr:hypothetical protein [Thermococcus sp.]
MRAGAAIAIILAVGILISVILRTYIGITFAALGIPLYLAYVGREQNILTKSRIYDRDLFLMTAIAVIIIIAFRYIWDPRVGLISLAVLVPILALCSDRLKGRKKAQNT